MTTNLEDDLRREFDAATPTTGSLTFSAESVLQQGRRTIRRRRIIAGGSAAFAVALIATGASLLTQSGDRALPLPATRATDTATTGIVLALAGFSWGQVEVHAIRDARSGFDVQFSATANGKPQLELGRSSIGKPGQGLSANWKSGVVNGHPVTFGVFPGSGSNPPTITFADGSSYAVGAEPLEGTGYSMFYVQYSDDGSHKEPPRPAEIASIRWSAANGIVDGIEGDHRLTGRVLSLGDGVSVEVVLRPGIGGRTTVFGQTRSEDSSGGGGSSGSNDLTVATTDPSGVAVVTGDQLVFSKTKEMTTANDGAPIAAGILPPGASGIGWILSEGSGASPVVVSERLPDGRVIFAITVQAGQESALRKATVRTVTWTNADGSQGTATPTPRPSTGPARTTAQTPAATATKTPPTSTSTSTASTSGLPGAPPCQPSMPGANVPGIEPALIFMGCATSANHLKDIRWSTWTTTGATGSGTHGINDCKPDCASGTYTYFPVNVELTNPGRENGTSAPDGMLVFKTIVMSPTSSVGRPETVTSDRLNGVWGWTCSSANGCTVR